MNVPNGDDSPVLSSQDVGEQTRLTPLQTQAVYHVAHSLIAFSGLPNLLQSIVNSTAEVLPANRVTLITFDVEARQVIHFVKGGPGINHVVKVSFDELWDGLSGWALRELKPALSHDPHNEPRESPEARQRNIETNCGAIIVVPLQFQKRVLGTMTAINRPDEAKFTNDDVALMMAIANLSAVAIENSLLYAALQATNADLERRVKERTAELAEVNTRLQHEVLEQNRAEKALHEREQHSQSLLRLSTKLENTQTYADVLNAARDEVKQVMGYQNLWVYLLTEDKKCFKALVAGGLMADTVMSEEGAATLPIQGDLMLEEIAEAKTIVVVEDAQTDARTDKEIVARLGCRTIVNVPIILFDQHLGSVGTGTFGDEGVRVPTQPEQEYLAAMASHMAVTLHRMHLLVERKRADEERVAHLRFFEGLDRVNRTMQAITDLDQMMRDILDVLLSIFDCDRAWLVYPCDPEATTWQVSMERTRPEYPSVLPLGIELPLDQVGASVYRILRDSSKPVQFNRWSEHQVPVEMAQGFNVQSFIAMAFYPKVGKPWAFGLHQCSYPRVWTPEEERLFQAISHRLADALSSLLTYRDLQKSEQELRQSNNLLQSVIEAAPTAIIGIDLDGNVQLVWNSAAEKMLGWTAAEAMGQLLPSVQRENQEQFKGFRDRIRRGESMNGVEVNRQKRDGSPIDYSIYASPLYDANGSLMGNIAILVDITERKQQEKAWIESETRYRSIVTAMSEGIVLQDCTGAILTYNAAAESILGLMGHQMLGEDSVSLDYRTIREDGTHFPGDEHPAMITLRTGIPQRNVIMGIQKTDGNLTWISINSEPLTHPHEIRPYAVITSFADITERKRIQSIMQARLRLLEFAGTHSMDELLTATLDEIEKLTNSEIGFYHFLQPDQKTLSLQNWSTKTLKTLCRAEGKGSHYSVDQAGVWVDCVHERRPVIHNDYASLPHRKGLPEGHTSVIRQAVVPIFRGNLIEAIIGLGNKPTPYNDNDIQIISQLGDMSWDITERKRAEEALRQSELQFRLLAENSTDMITRHSPDGVYLYVSPACTTLLGYEPSDLIGHSAYEFFHPDDVPAVAASHTTILAQPMIFTVQYRIRRKDGQYIWFETTSKTIADEKTNIVTEIQTASRDITERKHMEQILAIREQESRTLLENIPDLIVRYDTNLHRIYVNPAWEKSSGLMIQEVVNRPLGELSVPNPIVAEYLAKLQEVLETGTRETAEFTWVNARGEALTLNYTIVPEYNPNGQLVSILCVGHDITERKQAEVTLQHYSQRLSILHKIDRHILKARSPHDIADSVLEQVIHLIPCEWAGIMFHDNATTEARMYALQYMPDTCFHAEKKYAVLSNEAMDQLKLGHSIIIPDLQTALGPHTELSKQLMAEDLHAKLMTPLITQDQLIGVLILASRQVAYFTEEHQQVAEEIGIQLAIAFHQANLNNQIAQHTVELERRVRERTAELEHVNRELEAFSYSVSHDLRAPLRAIEGFAEIIARRHREALNDEGQRYFDNIVQASEQMNQLIGDLLTYARLGRQRQGLLKLTLLNPILAETQANLAPLLAETGGQIQIANDLPAVRGDTILLKQIFTNLLENALVYHRPGVPPVVRVTFTLEAHTALIVVEDNGIGIAPEFREKIFGIFQRLHNQEEYPGTGIGLAIVRKTVEMLGGAVWVESADAEGSRFCVKLFTEPEKDR